MMFLPGPTPERQLNSVTTTPAHSSTASPPPLLRGRESFKLMVIAFQGPSVFTFRKVGRYCGVLLFFSKLQYELD